MFASWDGIVSLNLLSFSCRSPNSVFSHRKLFYQSFIEKRYFVVHTNSPAYFDKSWAFLFMPSVRRDFRAGTSPNSENRRHFTVFAFTLHPLFCNWDCTFSPEVRGGRVTIFIYIFIKLLSQLLTIWEHPVLYFTWHYEQQSCLLSTFFQFNAKASSFCFE